MPKQAKLKPNKTPAGWCINIPASLSKTGKRQRFFYPTREEAREAAERYKESRDQFGDKAAAISPSLAEAAVQAEAKLEPYGLTLAAAVDELLVILRAREESLTLAVAAEKWIASREEAGCREATLKSYRYTVTRLASLSETIIADITPAQVEAAIESKPTSFAMHRRNARALFEYSAKRGWCAPGVVGKVEARGTQRGEVSTLKPKQVKAVLAAAEQHYPETVAAFAIAFFAGLRMGELERLKWQDIHGDGIEVASETSKKKRRRFVPMNPTLEAWLEGRRPADSDCLVIPGSWQERYKAARRLAGFKVVAPILENPPKLRKNAPTWPQNVMRHTHASAAVANGANVGALEFSFGHSGGSEMLRQHYVGCYRPKDALAFWAIGPKGTELETLRVA